MFPNYLHYLCSFIYLTGETIKFFGEQFEIVANRILTDYRALPIQNQGGLENARFNGMLSDIYHPEMLEALMANPNYPNIIANHQFPNIIANHQFPNINSPLEQFEVISLFGINIPALWHFNFTITNLGFYSMVILFIIVGLHYAGNNNTKLVPSKWSILLESSFATINSMVRDQIGRLNEIYFPFIYSLFFFVLIANLVGNIPYSFTITTSVIVTLGLSFTILVGATILALYLHRLVFFSFFIPGGTPLALVPLLVLIELVSYCARAFSLGIRLFANMCGGHTLLKILSTFLYQLFTSSFLVVIATLVPFVIFIGLIGLELAVSFIQAYVFSVLVCSYIKDAIVLH